MRVELSTAGACRPRGNGRVYPARILTVDTPKGRLGIDAGYGPLTGGCWQQRLYRFWFRTSPGPVRTDVDELLLTHAHLDHVGGAGRLPCTGPAWPEDRGGVARLRQAVFPETKPSPYTTLPAWTHRRWGFSAQHWRGLELIDLPGHAPGHLGVYFESVKLFFVTDAVWSLAWLADARVPGWVYPLQHDKQAYRETLERLRRLVREEPGLTLRCSHDSRQPDHEVFHD